MVHIFLVLQFFFAKPSCGTLVYSGKNMKFHVPTSRLNKMKLRVACFK